MTIYGRLQSFAKGQVEIHRWGTTAFYHEAAFSGHCNCL